ncbi:MAG: aminotransferase class V-fold PLP-dependent enzyme [candidate division WOR-3 bacterium]|nr:MAG: aminotransferase class V-fold PLP-dependent enzyme [candidate division WOR-3 bacterium]
MNGTAPSLAQIRSLFPITRECVYFNHAGTGPMSLPARRAIERCIDLYSKNAEYAADDYFRLIHRAREKVAQLINALPEEIVLTHNTSEGIYIALANLPWREGDVVLVMEEVFPAVRYVVDNNLPGVKKRYVPFSGRDPVEVVRKCATERVKAVVVDHVQFLSGETVDLVRLGDYTKSNNMVLVVDGIQSIGALAFDVQTASGVDFVACGSAKWLFGPSGAGFLYVNRRNFQSLGTLHTGWLGAGWLGWEDIDALPALYPDARRFEMGTRNVIGILALSENVDILLQYGKERVEQRIASVKSHLRRSFDDLGFTILTPVHGTQSGIITVQPKDRIRALHRHLTEAGVVLSLRNEYLRFSPHFYNTEGEVDQIISAIRSF